MKAICRSCGQELELEICPTEQDLKENPSLDAFEKCWIYPQHWYQGYWCDESGCYVANCNFKLNLPATEGRTND